MGWCRETMFHFEVCLQKSCMLNRGANYSVLLIPQVSAGGLCYIFLFFFLIRKNTYIGQRSKEGGKNKLKKERKKSYKDSDL